MLRAAALALAAALIVAVPAGAADPRLRTPKRKLTAALTCATKVTPARPQPLLWVTGTGSSGAEGYNLVKDALLPLGRPVCYVEFPAFTTADLQVSVEYLVHAIRTVARRSRKPIAIFGLSQGGLLPRWALTYWPSLRRRVTDVVAVAGTQHGSVAMGSAEEVCGPYGGCAPAVWQQAAGSRLLRAINNGRDETPGRTAWTTVRSETDETVRPPESSALAGATNLSIQEVCPGRSTSHVGTGVDSVTIAALKDAITHRGSARRSRVPAGVCDQPFGEGIDPELMNTILNGASGILGTRLLGVPRVPREPPVRRYATR